MMQMIMRGTRSITWAVRQKLPKITLHACQYLLPDGGDGALIFTIGLGPQVLTLYPPDPIPHGVAFLRYAALVGDGNGDPAALDPCVWILRELDRLANQLWQLFL